jgi:lysophospholipase L1-like esterase
MSIFYKDGNATTIIKDGIEYQRNVSWKCEDDKIILTNQNNRDEHFEERISDWFKEDGVTPIGDDIAEAKVYAKENAVFKSAVGGSTAGDFDPTTVLDRTFTGLFNDFTIVNGTATNSAGKLLISCTQAENNNTTTLSGGVTNAGITRLTLGLNTYGKSIMTDCDIRTKIQLRSASTSGRRYFGVGMDGNGYKTPADGGWLYRYSSTSAQNGFFLKDQENAIRLVNSVLFANNDEVEIISRWRGSYVHFQVFKNGTFVGSWRVNGSNENDNLCRSSGQFCLYSWGVNYEILEMEVIDVMPNNMDLVIIGDSNTQGWGKDTQNYIQTCARLIKTFSSKVVGIYGRSSLMIRDGIDVLHEPLRNLKKGGTAMIDLGTNDASATPVRTLAEMQADTLANIAYINALGKGHKIILLTPPPIGGSTSQNTKTHDYAQWLLATDFGANVTVSNTRSVLTAPSLTTWNTLLTNDGTLHLNEEGDFRKFEFLKIDKPEIF